MAFTLLPAVDVSHGRSVRLAQGNADTETAHGDPLDVALSWQADGADWIHLVDLDAAFGRGSNADLLAAAVGELDIKVQLAGGITDDATLERALATRCERAVIATPALADPDWCARAIAQHGDRVAIGLDVHIVKGTDGVITHQLAARGTTNVSGDLWETLARLERDSCQRYIVTDVSKDGMLTGPNIELYRAVINATTAPVIASGGVSAVDDLVTLAEAAAAGANLEGSIVGQALYAGRFTLPEALAAMQLIR